MVPPKEGATQRGAMVILKPSYEEVVEEIQRVVPDVVGHGVDTVVEDLPTESGPNYERADGVDVGVGRQAVVVCRDVVIQEARHCLSYS